MAPLLNGRSRALLLLPPPPSPPTFTALKAAYGPSLSSVLTELARSRSKSQGAVVLDIALPCDHLYGKQDQPRSSTYATTQRLVAGLYKLVCVISAKESIDVEDADGIDPRLLLLAYPRNGKLDQALISRPELDTQGPIINIPTLASCSRPWDTIYAVESEEGEQILKTFLSSRPQDCNIHRVPAGVVQVSPQAEPASAAPASVAATIHYSVAVGGTFDHLHIGHKLLLTMFALALDAPPETAEIEQSLTIGITGDELLKNKKFAEFLESWSQRQQSVHDFMSSILDFGPNGDSRVVAKELTEPGPNGHAVHVTFPSHLVIKYVEIWDPFGPTITDESISALVLSAETRAGGKAVNSKRAERGWPQLEVFEVDVLDAEENDGDVEPADESFQSKISSTEIRRMQAGKSKSKK
ncbi:pantetheine-phosphate adenylyltransferase family protein-like protein [Lophium mytilinum]|uniref:Pantetheine-phosphate adenylyltransferase family protein-like protein n=1 Tax=Lophium mytilinum TaxID=390894 RepID=A0A6A6RBV5_9PEZI|nr:pantetheine-phosphate adenylyltransferase family protein-like protein [Lophium mytilinum]